MPHDYPIRFTDQLRQHLRALRKKRGLTQAQIGAMIGVSQARIAEIEANPGLVSFDQMMQLLSALEVNLSLSDTDPTSEPDLEAPKTNPAAAAASDNMRNKPARTDESTAPPNLPLTTKKGSW